MKYVFETKMEVRDYECDIEESSTMPTTCTIWSTPAPLSAEMWTELCRDAPQGSGCSRGEDESAIQDTAAV